jgi:hypothetical protein
MKGERRKQMKGGQSFRKEGLATIAIVFLILSIGSG